MIRKENIKNKTKTNKEVGAYCKNFRIDRMCMTLADVCRDNNINYKSFWAFEAGAADGIRYIFAYINCCDSEQMSLDFIKGLFLNENSK